MKFMGRPKIGQILSLVKFMETSEYERDCFLKQVNCSSTDAGRIMECSESD
jgi:hypothetical protein